MLLKILTSRPCRKRYRTLCFPLFRSFHLCFISSILVNLQELLEEERKVVRPLVQFLRQRMEVESLSDRWNKFKERLGCCGGLTRMTINMVEPDEDDEVDDRIIERLISNQAPSQDSTNPGWMSLAMALAEEREFGAEKEPVGASLMTLMEETDARAEQDQDIDMGCCVCMTRKKGAAFIPCGHTFCRACARQVWVRRGTCPLCKGKIHEVLHIY